MSVLVAYLHNDTVSHSFMDSLWRVNAYEQRHDRAFAGRMAIRSGPCTIPEGRNAACRALLEGTEADWLWFVDSDMGFRDDCVERLVGAADPVSRPVVGALCYGQFTGKSDGMGGSIRHATPTLFTRQRVEGNDWDGFSLDKNVEVPEDQLVHVAATGCACLLIHRSVVQQIGDKYDRQWFTRITRPNGAVMGEDMSFCERLWEQEIPVYVHTGIPTTHHKSVFLGQ